MVLVTFTHQRNLRGYRGRFRIPYPVVTDESRATYRAYGLGRGSLWRLWGPPTWKVYARLLRKGAHLQRPKEDTLQLGGDFVIGRDGRFAFEHPSKGPDDRPPIDDLIAAVRSA